VRVWPTSPESFVCVSHFRKSNCSNVVFFCLFFLVVGMSIYPYMYVSFEPNLLFLFTLSLTVFSCLSV